MKETAKWTIKGIAARTTSRAKVYDLCEDVYWMLRAMGIGCSILNGKSVVVDGEVVWFRRDNKKDCWRPSEVIDHEYAYI